MITQKIIARTDSLKLDKIISRYGEDSMRQVVFIIVRPDPDSEELIPITIPEDAVGSFRILKPSGNFVIVPMSKSVLASGETAFDVVLPASANTAKGSGYYDIRITSDTDKYYFTAQGDFLIDDNIISDEVLEDVSEVNGLIFPDDFLTVEDHVAYIDDETISTDRTWSSNKINEEIEAHAGGDVSKTVSGNPIEINDAASAPLVRCVTEIQGSQDLHGYDKPWVGGSGKNKLPLVLADLKSANTSGTWNGNDYTLNNVTFTVNADSSGNITGINVNSTGATARTNFVLMDNSVVNFNNLVMSGCPSSGGNQTYKVQLFDNTAVSADDDTGSGATITAANGDTCRVLIIVYSGISISNQIFYPMIRQSGTTADFAPYSNICPITAYTEGEIEVSDGDGNTTTHTTTFPTSIYRGSEDVVKGTETHDMLKKTFDGTESWNKYDTGQGTLFRYSVSGIKPGPQQTVVPNLLCSHYPTVANNLRADKTISQTQNGTVIDIIDNNYSDTTTFAAAVVGMEIAYELATPTTSSVTTTNLPIKSLSGYTHIESSTGDMEVEYITQRFQPLIDSIAQL